MRWISAVFSEKVLSKQFEFNVKKNYLLEQIVFLFMMVKKIYMSS
jgi:hypothetical protein